MAFTWLAIVNPSAGPLRPRRWRATLEARLRGELGAHVVRTEGPGHAQQLAAGAHDVDGLAVFGGDGTVAEVVNGMALGRQRLLMLAGGTGNGLARDLGLTSLDAAFAAAGAGRVRALDLVRIAFRAGSTEATRLAISTASIGYAAEVVDLSNRYFKRLGPLCYPLAATLQAARQRSFPARVQVDASPAQDRPLSNLMVNNTRHAGNFSAFRESRPDDGLLDVLLARAGFLPQVLHNLSVLTKSYLYATATEFTAEAVEISLSEPARLMIDGELWPDVSTARFEVLPRALQCVA